MSRPVIDQLVDGYAEGDAISIEARSLQHRLRALGASAEIFAVADRIAPSVRDEVRALETLATRTSDALILHYSIASPAVEAWRRKRGRKIFLYHNVTPASFFAPYDAVVGRQLEEARAAAPATARAADSVWAVSRFNASELEAGGVGPVHVFPLASASDGTVLPPPDPLELQRWEGPLANLLFVGRLAPNKCVEELIRAFAWYHRCLDPFSRLVLVGSPDTAPRYVAMLRMLTAELECPNVLLVHYLSPGGLAAAYARADVFVTASRHEGFCLPLVEAMRAGVPVVARHAGGMPEALGDAGVLFDDASPAELAVLLRRVMKDRALREEVLASQQRRLAELDRRDIDGELRTLLAGTPNWTA